jgi:hypothetical protein
METKTAPSKGTMVRASGGRLATGSPPRRDSASRRPHHPADKTAGASLRVCAKLNGKVVGNAQERRKMPALSFNATKPAGCAALGQVVIATRWPGTPRRNCARPPLRPQLPTTLGYLAVLALVSALLGLIVWGLMRVARSYRDPSSGPPPERARRPVTTTTGRVAPAR